MASGVVNTAYSLTFAASGGSGPYTFSVTAGTLPTGLKLSSAGVLSGTPTAVGQAKFTVQVSDTASSTITRDFVLTIAPQPLTLTTPPLANTPVNTPVSVQFTGSGGVPPYTFVEFGTLPPGVQMTSAGLLSGTPTKTGVYPFLVYIDDSAGASASQKYSLSVAVPGLLITPASPLPPGQVSIPYTTPLAATGGSGPNYNWTAKGLPPGLTIANNTGLIAGIPTSAGTFTIAVTIVDINGLTATQNYTLVIASTRLTSSTTALSNGAVGSAYRSAVAATGGTLPYSFSATGLPAGLCITSTGTISGTPTTAGSFTVSASVTDAQSLTASAQFPVTITSKLVVTGVTLTSVTLGSPVATTKLTATGGTPPYQWQAGSPPPRLSLTSDDTLSGTPTAAGTTRSSSMRWTTMEHSPPEP